MLHNPHPRNRNPKNLNHKRAQVEMHAQAQNQQHRAQAVEQVIRQRSRLPFFAHHQPKRQHHAAHARKAYNMRGKAQKIQRGFI